MTGPQSLQLVLKVLSKLVTPPVTKLQFRHLACVLWSRDHHVWPLLPAFYKQSQWGNCQGKLHVPLVNSPQVFLCTTLHPPSHSLPLHTHMPSLPHTPCTCTHVSSFPWLLHYSTSLPTYYVQAMLDHSGPPPPLCGTLWMLFFTWDFCCFLLNHLHLLGLPGQLGFFGLLLLSDAVIWKCLVRAILVPMAIVQCFWEQ